ncbi:MAG: DUF493 domain-containing protein [Pseudomonadota bacterium]|nr:DUF493 domain-containing protein [Pseudomonadales bacterium]MDY6919561.1 DUF493 domain-containing protein [Pseudomonadota bacterium]
MGIQEHLWEFPSEHQLKIMGLAQHPMVDIVTDIVSRHAPDFDRDSIRCRHSGSGKYVSVTVAVRFTHKEQVEALYRDLHACEQVTMSL